jgi:fructose-1,6-bisphosphatase/inositol monophosphatase family enzyme
MSRPVDSKPSGKQHLKPWDVAAGALIVEEAGGRVTGMDGAPFDPAAGHLIASNGRLHETVLDVIVSPYRACS